MSKNTKAVRDRVKATIARVEVESHHDELKALLGEKLTEEELEIRLRNLGWLDANGQMRPKPIYFGHLPAEVLEPTANIAGGPFYSLSEANEKIMQLRLQCLDRAISTLVAGNRKGSDFDPEAAQVVKYAEAYLAFLVAGEIKVKS